MKNRPRFPLLAKVLAWLLLHLLILVLAFGAFVGWQLRLGLDSLLSGAAGDRLRAFGEEARAELIGRPRPDWNQALRPLAAGREVEVAIFDPRQPGNLPFELPTNVNERIKTSMPPPPPDRRGPPPARGEGHRSRGPGPRPPDVPDRRPPTPEATGALEGRSALQSPPIQVPASRPVFLLRGDHGNGYWAGIQLAVHGSADRPQLLLIRSDRLDGSGMFFDLKPWIWGGLAVLGLSLALWIPFVLGITRYLKRLAAASDRIAAGDFNISLPARGNDELGSLGSAIEGMAIRLDHLVSGQKRFLGDAAHELCAPLARLRTGLGILEMKLPASGQTQLASIESDAQELATLVEEILAFSRAGSRKTRCERVQLEPLIREAVAREAGPLVSEIKIADQLATHADPALLSRALGNLVRNARIHAGPGATLVIHALEEPDRVLITVADNGPGVPADELPRLFEPFYRPDLSRSRETGGNGLGLAIVRTAVEACGGECHATAPEQGGFSVSILLPKP